MLICLSAFPAFLKTSWLHSSRRSFDTVVVESGVWPGGVELSLYARRTLDPYFDNEDREAMWRREHPNAVSLAFPGPLRFLANPFPESPLWYAGPRPYPFRLAGAGFAWSSLAPMFAPTPAVAVAVPWWMLRTWGMATLALATWLWLGLQLRLRGRGFELSDA